MTFTQIRAVQHNIHTALGVNQRYENSKETEKNKSSQFKIALVVLTFTTQFYLFL